MQIESLLDPQYMGGLDGAKGYRFETSYILSQLPPWLSLIGLKYFQQEGWSDVELFFESGIRRLIQIKDHLLTLEEFRKIIHDFSIREAANPNGYERYVIACAGLIPPIEKLNRQLNRYRDTHLYTNDERTAIEKEIYKTTNNLRVGSHDTLILEKVYFDSDIASLKNADFSRTIFIGSLVLNYKISSDTAEDIFLRTAHLLSINRGKPIELSLFHNAVRQKQLEDQASILSNFTLVTKTFLSRFEVDVPSFFYTGATPTWSDIVHQRDIPRDITHDVLSLISQWKQGKILVPITAEAGEGKSTVLRRLAAELAAENKLVLYNQRGATSADLKEVQWVASIGNQCVYIFLTTHLEFRTLKVL